MSKKKFEAEPYHKDVVFDARVQATLSKIAQHDTEWDYQRREHPKTEVKAPADHYINNLEQIDYVGSDGESWSGCISFTHVTTPEDEECAVIRSWQFQHESGLPGLDTSWYAHFRDVETAKTFWQKEWRPNFTKGNILESLHEYITKKPSLKGNVGVYDTGLLKPWFLQKTYEVRLLERYSSTGSKLVDTGNMYTANPNFPPGQIYKVPVQELYIKPRDTAAKTCLGAFSRVVNSRSYWSSSVGTETYDYVQWSDGELGTYRHGDEYVPIPLTRKDIARPKPAVQNS